MRIVPNSPTTVPVSAFRKKTHLKTVVFPLVCEVQVVPPSVVLRIVPFSPTTVPVLVLIKYTPLKKLVVPLD